MRKQKSKKSRLRKKALRKPKFLGLPNVPPTSRRLCVNCGTERTFKFNRMVGHSECVYCGLRFTKKEGEKDNGI